ncbi:helix-turn-helix transcriptional regulator [Nocardia fusca]|uniref:Helix-turn-helix transcriptional regulator n=1 Tax=Nocardia fusca TaxID=941183 RepID=A0ABV3FJG7_9NOCA
MSKAELADFLRRRREALHPDRVPAVAAYSPDRRSRRTPGLRREEVAALANVSFSYYERLEQARAPHPSPEVLAKLGTALQLTAAEFEHLVRLAGQVPPAGDLGPTPVPADAQQLLDRLGSIPAYLVDGRLDIVAWNPAAAALITDFGLLSADERNVVRLAIRYGGTLCGAPPSEEGALARQFAAQLRSAGVRYPADRGLGELVDELAAHSPEFAAGWRNHDVRPVPTLHKHLRHSELGELEVTCQTLLLPGTDLQLAMYIAEPGSPSATALARLGTHSGARNMS